MMEDKPVFIEKQYLGREWIPVTIRLVLAIFCFAAYTFNFFTNATEKADILAVAGFGIIIISIIMGFMLHFRIRVTNKSILVDGLWTTRLVKIDLNSIVKAEIGVYSRYLFNNPVYNLHQKRYHPFLYFGEGCHSFNRPRRVGVYYRLAACQ